MRDQMTTSDDRPMLQGQMPAQGWDQRQDTFAPSPPNRPSSQSSSTMPTSLVRQLLVDTVLSVLLALEMCYQLTGNTMHELIGALLFVGMATHLLLSRKWLAGAFRPSKGAGGSRRVALLIVAILLMVDATVLAVSSLVISNTLATWGLGLGSLNGSGMWPAIHSLSAYGLCAITVVHLAMHWSVIARAMDVRYSPARRNAIGYAVGAVAGIWAIVLASKGGLSAASMVPSGQATGLVAGEADTAQVGTDSTDGVTGGRHASSAQDVQTDTLSAEVDATNGTDGLSGTDGDTQPYAYGQAQAPDLRYDDATEPSAVAGGTPNDDAGFPQEGYHPVAEGGQTDGQDDSESGDRKRKRLSDGQDDDDDDDDNGSGAGNLDGFCPLCHNHCPLTNPGCMRPRNAGLIS